MCVGDCRVVKECVSIIGLRRANEYAGLGVCDRGWPDTGILQCFPSQLEEDPLLRIDLHRLARRNSKHTGIEAPDVVQHARRPRITLPALMLARMAEPFERKA